MSLESNTRSLSLLLMAVLAISLLLTTGCAAPTPMRTSGQSQAGTTTAMIVITNASREPVHQVYMSSSSQSTWGRDHLGGRILAVGASLTLTDLAPGQWDIRVVDSSGNYKEWYRQTLRPGGEYALSVDGEGWTRGR